MDTFAPQLLSRRFSSPATRIRWLSGLSGGLLPAFKTMVRIRLDGEQIQRARYDGTPIYFRGVDEQALKEVLIDREYEFLAKELRTKPVPRVLDVGAHIGTFAMWALATNPSSRITSLEASPDTYEVLLTNRDEWRRSGSSWNALRGAAGARDGGVVRMAIAQDSMSNRVSVDGTVEVKTMSLGTLLRDSLGDGGDIDMMKVDIEGAEEDFLCSEPELLARIGAMVIELHPIHCNTKRVEQLLSQHFSSIEPIGGRQSSKPLLYCRRNSHSPNR